MHKNSSELEFLSLGFDFFMCGFEIHIRWCGSLTHFTLDWAIFNLVSTVIQDCFGFALRRYVIGLKNSRHFLDQSDSKLKPKATRPRKFSRGSLVFYFEINLSLVPIGRCIHFGLTLFTPISVCIFSILLSNTFLKVLTRRICSTIKSFFSWWSFPIFWWSQMNKLAVLL